MPVRVLFLARGNEGPGRSVRFLSLEMGLNRVLNKEQLYEAI